MTDWRVPSCNQRLIEMLKNGLGNPYDVIFVVGPGKEEVKGHQFILRLHSPVFEEKFNKEINVCPIVSIEDGNKQDFELFLKILYTGNISCGPKHATQLLKYALDFKMWDLLEWCWKSLEDIIEVSAVTVYEFAIKFGKNSLRDRALQFILSNASTILDSDEFLKFTSHNLVQVLESDELAAKDETQVFKAVRRWAYAMCKRDCVEPTGVALRNMMTDLLPKIRFPVMSKSDFSMMVAPLELLTDTELISILLYFNIDKDKLFRNDIPPGTLNGKERTWFKKRKSGQEHLLHRLEPLPKELTLRLNSLTRKSIMEERHKESKLYVFQESGSFRLRFSVDTPIWITSVGVNAVERWLDRDTPKNSQITFGIGIMDAVTGCYLSSCTQTVEVSQLNETLQLYFSKPIQVEPGNYYTLQFRIFPLLSRRCFGLYEMYLCPLESDGRNQSIFVEGKTITFRFEEVPGQDPELIGLTKGFVPTIGFELHSKTQQISVDSCSKMIR